MALLTARVTNNAGREGRKEGRGGEGRREERGGEWRREGRTGERETYSRELGWSKERAGSRVSEGQKRERLE